MNCLVQGSASLSELCLSRRSPAAAINTFNLQLQQAKPHWERAIAVEHKISLDQAHLVSAVKGLGFRVWGLGFEGLGFRV